MKSRKIVMLLIIAGVITCLSIWAAVASPKVAITNPSAFVPPAFSDTEPEPHPTVPLPRLVEHYQEQLDPDIPKITVTARVYGDGYAADLHLPYDGVIRTTEKGAELDANQTWFVNLMNNFWSLPKLYDEQIYGLDGLPPSIRPAHLTIQFSEIPDGMVTVVDHVICNEFGRVDDPHFRYTNNVYQFEAENGELSFDLWEYDGVALMSNQPKLRGLQLQCTFGQEQVEYYILFQTEYYAGEFAPGTDFSHLTPLEA